MRQLPVALFMLSLVGWSTTADAQLPNGMVFDDPYTWYEIENHAGSRNGQRIDEGWSLKAHLRIFGDGDRSSIFRLVVKKGRRTLAEMRCTMDRHLATEPGDVAYLHKENCKDRDMRVTETGEVQVEVHFIDGATEQDTLVRTHTLKVLTVQRDRRAPEHYIDRSSESAVSLIRAVPRSVDGYIGGTTFSHNMVEMIINVSAGETIGRVRGQLRCKVDGQPVVGDERTAHGLVRSMRHYRAVSEGRGGEEDWIGFAQLRVELPITFGSENRRDGFVVLDEHPGTWECEWKTDEGELLRSIRFIVNGGQLQGAPAEEAELGIAWGAHLIPGVMPGATHVDHRVHVDDTAFYGRAWATDGLQQYARSLPDIGPPPPGARARRGRRRR